MKIEGIKKISRENLTGKDPLPDWLDSLMTPINQFIDTVTTALRSNLSLSTNLAGTVTTQYFTHAVELKINPQIKGKVLGVIPLYIVDQTLDKFKWTRQPNGTVGVTISVDGGSSSTRFNATLFIIPEVS